MKNCVSYALRILAALALCLFLGVLISRLYWFREEFVFVTVEESSLNALVGWPAVSPESSGVFIDAAEKILFLPEKKSLLGVCLAVHYSASSQGVEFQETMFLSKTGTARVNLTAPVSLTAPDFDEEPMELVNNQARVLLGKLKVSKTTRDGTVHLKYGPEDFTLQPGESWAQLLVLEPSGPKEINPETWQEELQRCFQLGYPATRLAVSNRGMWPKSGVKAGLGHE